MEASSKEAENDRIKVGYLEVSEALAIHELID